MLIPMKFSFRSDTNFEDFSLFFKITIVFFSFQTLIFNVNGKIVTILKSLTDDNFFSFGSFFQNAIFNIRLLRTVVRLLLGCSNCCNHDKKLRS